MRAYAVAAATIALAACSSPHSDNATADVNAAAAQAQGDIDTYAANSLASTAQPSAQRSNPVPASTPPVSAPTPGPAPTPPGTVAEAPFTPDSAQGAADVVQTYFALIEAKKYGQAWALWDDGGRASGMSRAQFAASFAKYAEYHAEVGAPGRIDAGAGQRYVEVPARTYGTLVAGGRPFAMRGSVTLHRAADIDGATAEQKSWRISASSLKPRPADAADADTPATVTARYRCTGTTRFSVHFDNDADTATVRSGNRDMAVLQGQRPASGIWYKGGGYELRGKGNDANFTAPGQPPIACTAGG